MMLRVLVGLGAALGLASTFVYVGRDSSGAAPAQPSQPTARTSASIAAGAPRLVAADAPAVAPAFADQPGPARREREADADPADVPTAPTDFPTYDETQVELAAEHEIPAERSGAADANVRAAALREIDTTSPDSFALLEQTLRSDASARNRLLAVNSLRLLGKDASTAERAREVLRLALSDADRNVRVSAQDAYAEVVR